MKDSQHLSAIMPFTESISKANNERFSTVLGKKISPQKYIKGE